MVKRCIICILAGIILLCLADSGQAWDGQRKGFILGLGLGSGLVSFDEWRFGGVNGFLDFKDERVYRGAPLITDGKIGYAPDNFWLVYWTVKASYFINTSHYRPDDYPGDYEVDHAVVGLGCSRFFRPEAPSPFIAAGVGYSTWAPQAWIAGTKPKTHIGLGLFVGGGFEFSRHWSLEMYLSWGKPGMDGLDVDTDDLGVGSVLSLRASLNVLGY